MRYLEPHIQRALKIRWKLQTQEEAKQLREAALAELSSGVLILNHNGQLVFANPLAEDMLRLGNNPTTNHGKLSSINTYDRSAIDKAIMNANNGLGSTLRTQLKALFAKTGTKNQRELVQFCLENPS